MLLVSLGLGRVPEFVSGEIKGKVLAFVPTAATPYEDRSFVERDRIALAGMGFDVRDVPLEGKNVETLRDELAEVEVLFVAGGNSFYLLQEVKSSGFDVVLEELLDRGVPYIGASAGAILVGPDLRPVTTLDDPGAASALNDMTGLGLVNFVTLPHYGVENYLPEYHSIIKRYQDELDLIPLRNDQAVDVTGSEHAVVDSAE
ncbi:Type 1 glutamine amidotransferase-like domain-containing protein [Amycolatopsis sp. BJA-103]|uniref:Type 1 glutamine amidotransferase-like domain-containing protein n=1 Tax=Amycolatopsis sp. BJA-103 TaxID=1911175 RepID=UPI001304893B|nr:Type 1 glutamine amidotransferase-like domain-containing protein [Amycolatopsis sp. BJA-103]